MKISSVFNLFKRGSQHGISFLNGAVGDSLKNTPLEISMGFYEESKRLILDKNQPNNYFKNNQNNAKKIFHPKICILIHGLVNNEYIWEFSGNAEDYGTFLEKNLDYTPFYVRYNTGLHISDNGKNFTNLMQSLYDNYPIEISEITIIAHSMGGLVVHSACHYELTNTNEQPNKVNNWTGKVKDIFLLGTPHFGSFLEKFANVTTSILAKVPNWQTRLVGKVLNWRSEGIKDLRFGYLSEENWKNQNTDEFLSNNRVEIKTLDKANYHVISGQLGKDEKSWLTVLFGDILVHEKSAFAGNSPNNSDNLDNLVKKTPFNIKNQHTFPNTNHFALTSSQKVYDKIVEWLA